MSAYRRTFIERVGAGIAAAAFCPRSAYAAARPYAILSADEVALFERFAEFLVPGARAAGIAQFLDHELSGPPELAALFARTVNLEPPYLEFYRAGAAAFSAAFRARPGGDFMHAPERACLEFLETVRTASGPEAIPGWITPVPPGLFFFLVRSDAIDVVYGGPDGFKRLGLNYNPHILPPGAW